MRAYVNILALRAHGVRSNNNIASRLFSLKTGRRFYNNSAASSAGVKTSEDPRLPLFDRHSRKHNYLRISLTERCNLRCQYCMPPEGVELSPRTALLSRPELSRLVRIFATLGVDKIRLTGGEPTIRKDLAEIIEDIRSAGISHIGMTTNALVLTRKLPALQRAGLSAINISLDSLKPDKYTKMARLPGLPKVLAGIDLALQLGYSPVKVNTVLMKGFNDDEMCDFVEFTKDRNVEVRFIEFMPFTGNSWDDSRMVPQRTAIRTIAAMYPDIRPCVPRPNDTARVWQVPGHLGSVGFISSMTQHFCDSCNRLRLTADGNLKVCLFGPTEVSLRDALRAGGTDQELEDLIRKALSNKKAKHAESRPNGEPSHDSNRGIASHTSATFTDFQSNTCEHASGNFPRPPKSRYSNLSGSEDLRPNITGHTAFNSSNSAINRSNIPTELRQDFSPISQLSTSASKSWINPSTISKLPPVFLTPKTASKLGVRLYSTSNHELTHLDKEGKVRMVDVGEKQVTSRTAEAECTLHVSAKLLKLLKDAKIPKGDALTVAQIAGVVGAKKTSDLIPMCHQLALDFVRIYIELPKGECRDGANIHIKCQVKVSSRTGVEMEALTGAAISALALYDMCKAVDKTMRVNNLRVVSKTGGQSGDWPPKPVKTRAYDTTPVKPGETFVPTYI